MVVRQPAARASLRRVDVILLCTLVPCWVAAFALHVRQVMRGRLAWVPVYVSRSTDADGFPVVVGFRPETSRDETGLEHGDRLMRAGNADLRGAGPVDFVARVQEQADETLRVPVI